MFHTSKKKQQQQQKQQKQQKQDKKQDKKQQEKKPLNVDEALWKKAEAAFPEPARLSDEKMKKQQEPLMKEREQCVAHRKELINELVEYRKKLFGLVAPADAHNKTKPEERQKNQKGEKKTVYNPDEDERLKELFKYYNEFKIDQGGNSSKVASLTAKVEEIRSAITKLSANLVARNRKENEEKTRELERFYQSGSISSEEEKEIVQKLKALRKELAFSDSKAGAGVNDKKAKEAVANAVKTNISAVQAIPQNFDVSVYLVIDELKNQEKNYRDQIKTLTGSDGSKQGKDDEKTRLQKAEELYNQIIEKIKEIKEAWVHIEELNKKMEEIHQNFSKEVESRWEQLRELRQKRWEEYHRLVNEKREAENKARKDKWLEFIQERENSIQTTIDTLNKMESGEVAVDENKKPSKKQEFDPLGFISRYISDVRGLINQLNSIHVNHEIKLKGQGCKEADEAFAALIKKNETNNGDVKMLDTKKQQEINLRNQNGQRKFSNRSKKSKIVSRDEFLAGETEGTPATEDAAPVDEKPIISDYQKESLERYKIEVPTTFEAILETIEKLKLNIKERIGKELEFRQNDLKHIQDLKEQFLHPEEAKKEEEKKEEEKKENKEEKKDEKKRNTRRFGFTVPDELIREVFRIKDNKWIEKLGLNSKPRDKNNKKPQEEKAKLPNKNNSQQKNEKK